MRYEMEGHDSRLEMPVDRDALPSHRDRHELRGEEHPKELGTLE